MPRNQKDKEIYNFESAIMAKPVPSPEFKKKLSARMQNQLNKPSGILGFFWGVQWAALTVLVVALLTSIFTGMWILGQQNTQNGSNPIAGNKSSTITTKSGSGFSLPDKPVNCAAKYTHPELPGFEIPYDQCKWQISKQGERQTLAAGDKWTITLTGQGELQITFEVPTVPKTEVSCFDGDFVTLNKGYARFENGGVVNYLPRVITWEESMDEQGVEQKTCLSGDLPFLTYSDTGDVFIRFSYKGNNLELADEIVVKTLFKAVTVSSSSSS